MAYSKAKLNSNGDRASPPNRKHVRQVLAYPDSAICFGQTHFIILIITYTTYIYYIFNFPCSSKDVLFTYHYQSLVISSIYSISITALCSSCVATVFVQIMQRLRQSKACPCPIHEGICGSGGEAPQVEVSSQLQD